MLKTLVLNASYEPMYFINEKRLMRHLCAPVSKIEVINYWDDQFIFGSMKHPAIIKFKYYTKFFHKKIKFNKNLIFKRDLYCCQYCGYAGTPGQLTIDHILPKSRGGKNSFDNCITACKTCNNFKGSRTPDEAKMKSKKLDSTPFLSIYHDYLLMKDKHPEWQNYINMSKVTSIREQMMDHLSDLQTDLQFLQV